MRLSRRVFTGIVLPLLAACGADARDATPQSRQHVQEAPGSLQAIPSCDPIYDDNCLPPCDPDDDPSCGYTPPPPTPPPAQPSYLTYTPFSESSRITVSWPSTDDVTYNELQHDLNGTWSTVYTGKQPSTEITVPGDGLLSFRVRACNDGGCSSFAQDIQMRVSGGPERADAPAAVPSGVMGPEAIAVMSVGDGGPDDPSFEDPPTLGIGYDRLRQETTKNSCLDLNSAVVSDTPARVKNYQMSLVKTRDELATSLSMSQNLIVSAKYGKFSGSYSGKKELLANTTRVEETTMVVVSLRDQFHVKTLTNPDGLPILAAKVDLLTQGEQAKYRNHCGDAFAYSIAFGREAYFALQLDSSSYSNTEIQSKTTELHADIGSWVSAGYSSVQRSSIAQKYSSYSAHARVVSYGSSIPQSAVVDLPTAMQYMQSFDGEPIGNGEYPIDYNLVDYDVPAGLPVAMYPDYHPYQPVLQRWHDFDQQLASRCEYFDENIYGKKSLTLDAAAKSAVNGLSLRTVCSSMSRAVNENIQSCTDTDKWAQCIEPDALSCAVTGTAESCLTYASHLPVWQDTTAALYLDLDLGSDLFAKTKTVDGDACLPQPSILDPRVAGVDCGAQGGCPSLRDGVTVVTTELVRAKNPVQTWNPASACLHAAVTIARPGGWKSGARIHQVQTVHGLTPQLLSYSL
jgi:hypothetical protein